MSIPTSLRPATQAQAFSAHSLGAAHARSAYGLSKQANAASDTIYDAWEASQRARPAAGRYLAERFAPYVHGALPSAMAGTAMGALGYLDPTLSEKESLVVGGTGAVIGVASGVPAGRKAFQGAKAIRDYARQVANQPWAHPRGTGALSSHDPYVTAKIKQSLEASPQEAFLDKLREAFPGMSDRHIAAKLHPDKVQTRAPAQGVADAYRALTARHSTEKLSPAAQEAADILRRERDAAHKVLSSWELGKEWVRDLNNAQFDLRMQNMRDSAVRW